MKNSLGLDHICILDKNSACLCLKELYCNDMLQEIYHGEHIETFFTGAEGTKLRIPCTGITFVSLSRILPVCLEELYCNDTRDIPKFHTCDSFMLYRTFVHQILNFLSSNDQ